MCPVSVAWSPAWLFLYSKYHLLPGLWSAGLHLQDLGFRDPLYSPELPPCDSGCTIPGECGKDAEEGIWVSQTHPSPRSLITPSLCKVSLAAGPVDSGVLGQMNLPGC